VFAIQDEIALAITEKLKVTLLKKDYELITKSHTQNTEAYELYLKARFYLERRGASLLTCVQYFQRLSNWILICPGTFGLRGCKPFIGNIRINVATESNVEGKAVC
jgi:hypothetical protein